MKRSCVQSTKSGEADLWDQAVALGRIVIARHWQKLAPATVTILRQPDETGSIHFDAHGRFQSSESITGDSVSLARTLGIIQTSIRENISGNGVFWPAGYPSEQSALFQVNELLQLPAGRDPEFAAMAIEAAIRQETTNALYRLNLVGGDADGAKAGLLQFIPKILGMIVFGIGLPISIGIGLTFAFHGDAVTASLCALFAFIAVNFIFYQKETPQKPEYLAYKGWLELSNDGFPVATGHGIEKKLGILLASGVKVPSVFFDLCAILARG